MSHSEDELESDLQQLLLKNRARRSKYASTLNPIEATWAKRQPFLEAQGYRLRPRYQPGWVPSWRYIDLEDLELDDHEDSHCSLILPAHTMDAVHKRTGQIVLLKRIETETNELQLTALFSQRTLRANPHNHCVPLLDHFVDEQDPSITYIAVPFYHRFWRPDFVRVSEVIQFVDQMLEGLVFMHAQGVAHRDCSEANIMIDHTPMFPDGCHPMAQYRTPDFDRVVTPIPRYKIADKIRYYYIDFGESVYIPPDAKSKFVVGGYGRDRDPPELSFTVPYDPFKLDIFIVGNMFRRMFLADPGSGYANVEFLKEIIEPMTQRDPSARPDAHGALEQWRKVSRNVNYFVRSGPTYPITRPIGHTYPYTRIFLHVFRLSCRSLAGVLTRVTQWLFAVHRVLHFR